MNPGSVSAGTLYTALFVCSRHDRCPRPGARRVPNGSSQRSAQVFDERSFSRLGSPRPQLGRSSARDRAVLLSELNQLLPAETGCRCGESLDAKIA